MKSIGIIAEYNPFHSGHKYQIEQSREIIGADVVVAAISGDFVQRGMPAVYDKWTRAKMAVCEGVNLVVEIPTIYACNSAEYFAKGGVEVLEGFGAIDFLSFGSESGSLTDLTSVAKVLKEKDDLIHRKVQEYIKEGCSYPIARQKSAKEFLTEKELETLDKPNNILAIEYLKNINKMTPITIKRVGDGYHQTATKIREQLSKQSDSNLQMIEQRYFDLVAAKILQSSGEYLESIFSAGEGLGNKLRNEIRYCKTREELIGRVKSKAYTYTRVSRLLTHVLLGITEETLRESQSYIRVLALDQKGATFLKEIKKKESQTLPIITNINKDINCKKFNNGEQMVKTIGYDIMASDIYNILCDKSLYENSDYVIKPYVNLVKGVEK
ncbi:MAG: nucleotidyltransferase family protein [Anaerovoracaceae bacterium]